AYAALLDGSAGDRLVLVGIVAGSVLTVGYSARFVWALVRPVASDPAPTPAPTPAVVFWLPAAVLGAVSVVLGIVPRLWSGIVDEAARALDTGAAARLVLWPGLNTALALSVLT